MERVEEQVLHLRSQVVVELESRAARNQQRLTQLQAELALEREEHEGVSKVILECIMGALHALADHKEEVKRRLGTYGGGKEGRKEGRKGGREGAREGRTSTSQRTWKKGWPQSRKNTSYHNMYIHSILTLLQLYPHMMTCLSI